MKIFYTIFSLTLCLLAMPLYSHLAAQSEVEPNNTLAEATLIPLSTNITGSINPANDNDYYKFEITEPGVVTVRVFNVPANVGMNFRFVSQFGEEGPISFYNQGQSFAVSDHFCSPGIYVFRLAALGSNPAQYTVRIDFDTSDEYECNNSYTEANLIPLNTDIHASINPNNDNDYYKFEITEPGVVTIRVLNVPANIGMLYQFFNQFGEGIQLSFYNQGQNFAVGHLICLPGIYAFRLAAGGSNPAQYTVRVDFDTSDVYECNNSYTEAILIPLNTDIHASINPNNDDDYYKFEITEPGVVTIRVFNVPANIGMLYQFFNQFGEGIQLSFYNQGQNFAVGHLICSPGIYAFRLAAGGSNPAQYTVRVDFDTSDIYECNQNPNDAVAVPCNTAILASINPANDVDCYEVTLTQPDIITVQLTSVPGDQSMTVTLHGPEPLTQELRRISGNAGESVTLVSPTTLQAGTYQVCITGNIANAAQYQLNIGCPSVVSAREVAWAGAVALYPNPASDMLILELPQVLQPSTVVYQIIDPRGRVLLTRQAREHREEVDINWLPAGCYYLQLNTVDGSYTQIFFKR